MGRPSKYKPEFTEQAKKLCRLGATDADLAKFFLVAESTLHLWKTEHAEFSEALKEGKEMADAEVADKLFKRATGYSHEAVKIVASPDGRQVQVPYTEHYPPDTTAAIFWLKNRRPDLWRDQKVIDATVTHKTELTDADLEAIATGRGEGASGSSRGPQVTH
jgi:hypothetical protein